MYYNKYKENVAKKMKQKSFDEFDRDMTKGKMPKSISIYNPKGATNYINFMSMAEKQGKFKFDSRSQKRT